MLKREHVQIVLCWTVIVFGLLGQAQGRASGQPVFWAIGEGGTRVGYLLGTIHSEDPRVLEYSDEFLQILRGSRVFAMELVPNLPNLAELAERMRLPSGTTLEELAGAERFKALADALADYGIPPGQARDMQPWAAMMTISMPPPESGLFMDFSLSLRASGAGAKVMGLESVAQQLAFLEHMDLQQQLRLLDHAIEQANRVEEMHERMIEAYLANDLEGLRHTAMEQLQSLDPAVRDVFIAEGIEARNRRMLSSVLPELQQGGTFIAVGALHLPGDAGLLSLLRDEGYELEPAGWPFSGSP